MPFSYAQAAKGVQGAAAPSKPTPTELEKSDSKPEEQSNNAPVESVTATAEAEAPAPQETEKATQSTDQDAEFTTVTSKHAARSKAVHSRTSSPNVRSTPQHSKEADSSNTPNGTAEASPEKQDKSDTKAEKAENSAEGSKEKSDKSEKGEKGEKSEKNTPPKELKAAPLPSVNIWQQRKEAQEAKTKTVPASTSGKSASGKVDDSQQDSNKATSKKKGPDGAQEGTKDRKKTEGGKARDEALPPVGDASLWPTPQVALGEEKKKAQEKTDKPQTAEKSPVMRSHGKEKWMPVNYVPTAVFNTPLPSAGGRRAARGGRDGGRGGRDGGRGGGRGGPHAAGAAAGDKAASEQAAQGSAAKQATGERGRNESGTGRAASLPAQSRRSTSSDVANPEGRKAQAGERGRGPRGAEETGASNGKQTNGENFARPQRDGKQFTRNEARAGDRSSKAAHLAVDPQAAARVNDRRAESGSKSADPAGFQDFNRERGGRPNRRGPYVGFNGQNGQFGNMVNNNFVPKQFGFNDRQRSQHGIPNGSQQNNRMPMRSPSLPASGSMYGVYPFASDINPMYGYQAVAPGPMSAVPYQQYMEPFSLITMLSMQLEYYFSVDNMCKDMFLRRQMDSQGFVPLSVIASFKRVKSLTEDFELLRHVSRQLRNVEYVIGEDGLDRLRPRENWSQWILPVDKRDTAAQHDGPAITKQPGKNDENVPFVQNAEGVPNGTIHGGSREFIPNGTAHHGTRTPLSSTAPEFMPSMPSAQNEIANVGDPSDFFFSPEAGPVPAGLLNTPFTPLDDSLVDESHSARGLDLPLNHPLLSLEPVEYGTGPDAGRKKRYRNTSTRASGKPVSRRHHRPPLEKKKGSYKEKPANIHHSSETFHHSTFRGQSSRTNPTPRFVTDQVYRNWAQSLTRNFDLQLYNEFRHLALDELFTRHVQYGFDALMGFYHFSLLSPRPLPDEVIMDIVQFSRILPFNCHVVVLNLLQTAMASGRMEQRNRIKAGNAFNEEYSRPLGVLRRHTCS